MVVCENSYNFNPLLAAKWLLNQQVIIGMCFVAAGVAVYVWQLRKGKREVERKLVEIEEEHTLRPASPSHITSTRRRRNKRNSLTKRCYFLPKHCAVSGMFAIFAARMHGLLSP